MQPRTTPRVRHRFDRSVDRAMAPLYRLDNWHGPLAWLEDVAFIAVGIGLYLLSPWCLPLSALLIGSRQRALATLLHESTHRTLARNRWMNLALGTVLSGWWIFQTWYRYRQTHVLEHHHKLGEEPADPDTRHYVNQGLYDPMRSPFRDGASVIVFWLDLLWQQVKFLVRERMLPSGLSRMGRAAAIEYGLFVLFWCCVLFGLWLQGWLLEFLLLWILPYLTVFQMINWLIEVGEHFPLTRLAHSELEMSRNRHGTALELFFTGMHGENWHLVHHLRPGIPYWNLRTAHKIMMTDLAYARVNAQTGGLFTAGPDGAPSILEVVFLTLRAIWRPKLTRPDDSGARHGTGTPL